MFLVILLMKELLHQLRLVVYPIIYNTFQVVQDFFHQHAVSKWSSVHQDVPSPPALWTPNPSDSREVGTTCKAIRWSSIKSCPFTLVGEDMILKEGYTTVPFGGQTDARRLPTNRNHLDPCICISFWVETHLCNLPSHKVHWCSFYVYLFLVGKLLL